MIGWSWRSECAVYGHVVAKSISRPRRRALDSCAPDSWNYRIITEAFRARGLNIPRIRLATFRCIFAPTDCFRRMHHHVSQFRRALFFGAISGEGATGRIACADTANGYRDAENRTLSPVVERSIKHRRKFTASMGANHQPRPEVCVLRNLSGFFGRRSWEQPVFHDRSCAGFRMPA
jgi:hypothetical protein